MIIALCSLFSKTQMSRLLVPRIVKKIRCSMWIILQKRFFFTVMKAIRI